MNSPVPSPSVVTWGRSALAEEHEAGTTVRGRGSTGNSWVPSRGGRQGKVFDGGVNSIVRPQYYGIVSQTAFLINSASQVLFHRPPRGPTPQALRSPGNSPCIPKSKEIHTAFKSRTIKIVLLPRPTPAPAPAKRGPGPLPRVLAPFFHPPRPAQVSPSRMSPWSCR